MNPLFIEELVMGIVKLFTRRKKLKEEVLPIIEEADKKFPDAKERRAYVLNLLQADLGMSESSARLTLEAGLKYWKKIQEKLAKKAAKQRAS